MSCFLKYVMLLSSATLLANAAALNSPLKKSEEPWFCHDLNCPNYTVSARRDGYEVRDYDASKWVGTNVISTSWQNASQIGFMRLFDYISGENSAKEKIPMTAPVATKIVPGQGPTCGSNFTIFFFIPFKYQASTPAPTNPDVGLFDLPKLTAYVIQYSGFASDETVTQYASKLADALDKDKTNYVTDYYFCASYDPPYRIIDRHNEVWFLAV